MNKFILLLAIVLATGFLAWRPLPFAPSLWLILTAMLLLWLLSLRLRDASIVDVFWGPLFLLPAGVALWMSPAIEPRDWVLAAMVAVWALRLAIHIATRNAGHGEDPRYRKWREEAGTRWWWQSLLQVFVLQGLLVWIISAPLMASILLPVSPSWQWLDGLGLLLWLAGLTFEAVGDWQLRRFKADPQNAGEVMDRGLWALTRHPNYFGDALLWWGYYCFAAAAGAPELVIAPLLMTWLLLRVSGVALLETEMKQRKPAYQDYARRVPAFLPRLLPRSADRG